MQPKLLQIRQFDDFEWNRPYTRQDKTAKMEMANWFTTILFDVEIHVQDHWVKLCIYWPASWFSLNSAPANSPIWRFRAELALYKQSQDIPAKKMMYWFTTVLFDVEICILDHWVKLWIYRPVSLFPPKPSCCKFVNLTISGGIDPTQSQDQTAKNGRWWWFTTVLFDVEVRPQNHSVQFVKTSTCQQVCTIWYCKLVNLTISGGIGPNQSQDKKRKKGEWAGLSYG